jgi:autoinducer 2-degrading protein
MVGCSSRSLRAVLLVVGLVSLVPAALGDSEPNPIVAEVKKTLKDPAKPFTMVVKLQIKEGVQDKFEAEFAKAIKATRKEKGAIAYDLNKDLKQPTSYYVYERWQNLAALEDHLKTPHITTLLAELKEMLAGKPEVMIFLPAGE